MVDIEYPTQFPMTEPAEKDLLAIAFQRPDARLIRRMSKLKPGWIQTESYRDIVEVILPDVQKYKKIPSPERVLPLLEARCRDDLEKLNSRRTAFNGILTHVPRDPEAVYNDFTRLVSFNHALNQSAKNANAARRTGEVGEALVNMGKAVSEARSMFDESGFVSYFEDAVERQALREKQARDPRNFRLLFGIKKFDDNITINPGTVTGFVAPMKRYKSIHLVHAAWAAALQGLNTVIFTLENPAWMVANRLDSLFSFLDYSSVRDGTITPEQKAGYLSLMQSLSRYLGNSVRIKEMQPKRTTVADCAAKLEELYEEERFIPNVVIFDYANIMKAVPDQDRKNGQWEERLEQEQIVWDMQSLAKGKMLNQQNPVVVITAFQANVSGLDADRLKRSHVGKSLGIGQGVDNLIGINQMDGERKEGKIVLSFMVQRDGAAKVEEVEMFHQLEKMQISKEVEQFWKIIVGKWEQNLERRN